MANNTNYKPNEGKREEFRRYLEKTGVMDALTKVLVLLYEETDKPDDALKFILNALARQTGSETMDDLKAQITELQDRVGQLQTDNNALSQAAIVQPPEERVSVPVSVEQPLEGAEEVQEKPAESATAVDEPAA